MGPASSSPLLRAVHGPGHLLLSIFLDTFLLCPSRVYLFWNSQT